MPDRRAGVERAAAHRSGRAARRAAGAGGRHRRAGLRPLVRRNAVDRPARRSAPASGCRPIGPYLLYLCSSPFIAPYEVDVVRRWIAAIRGSGHDARSRRPAFSCGRIRRTRRSGATSTCRAFGDVGDLAARRRQSDRPDARSEYYDSMYHAHAVVGVNTSALIESGIVGRPVFSFHVPELAGTQEGTLHFQHLRARRSAPAGRRSRRARRAVAGVVRLGRRATASASAASSSCSCGRTDSTRRRRRAWSRRSKSRAASGRRPCSRRGGCGRCRRCCGPW